MESHIGDRVNGLCLLLLKSQGSGCLGSMYAQCQCRHHNRRFNHDDHQHLFHKPAWPSSTTSSSRRRQMTAITNCVRNSRHHHPHLDTSPAGHNLHDTGQLKGSIMERKGTINVDTACTLSLVISSVHATTELTTLYVKTTRLFK